MQKQPTANKTPKFYSRYVPGHSLNQLSCDEYTANTFCSGSSTIATRGVHPPETMMHFPPCFRFPPVSEKFSDFQKFFTIVPFPEKFLDFHPPKFLMTFFYSSTTNSEFPLFSYFCCFSTFPPCFAKIILSPLFLQSFPLF